jgi:DHA1 family tetracycline resistance protein-like MFS transporter
MSAQETRRAGPGRRAAVGFILVSVWLDVLSLGVVIPVYAPLIQKFEGGDAGQAARLMGLFSMVWALAQFFAAPLLGVLSDRVGRRPVILLSLFGLAIDYLAMAFAPSVMWLFVTRVIMGLTAGGMAAANAYIADVTPPERRAQMFGLIGAAWGVGFILGPAIGGVLGNIDLHLPFLAAAGVTLLEVLYGLFILPESLKPESRTAFDWKKANPVGALRFLGSHRELLGLSGVNFLMQLAHNVLPTVWVLYTTNRYGWNLAMTGVALAIVGVVNILVQGLLVKHAVARLGEWGTLLTGLVGGGLGFAIYGLAPQGWGFLLGVPVFGLIGFVGPGFQALATRRVAATEQGRLQGANTSLSGFASIFGPPLFGFTYAWFVAPDHPHAAGAAFLLAAALHGVAALLAFVLMARSPKTVEVAA